MKNRPSETAARSAELFYVPTHIRCGAWIVGVILGYMFYKSENKQFKINKVRRRNEFVQSHRENIFNPQFSVYQYNYVDHFNQHHTSSSFWHERTS